MPDRASRYLSAIFVTILVQNGDSGSELAKGLSPTLPKKKALEGDQI
jgi:hypothetical protein